MLEYINDPFNNGLKNVDVCRLLYIGATKNNVNVIDMDRCIGDIYRDEPIDVYENIIKNIYN